MNPASHALPPSTKGKGKGKGLSVGVILGKASFNFWVNPKLREDLILYIYIYPLS
jgi:hypothetical protein